MLMAGQLLCASQGNRVSQLAAASPRRLALFYQWDEECFLNLDKKKKNFWSVLHFFPPHFQSLLLPVYTGALLLLKHLSVNVSLGDPATALTLFQ